MVVEVYNKYGYWLYIYNKSTVRTYIMLQNTSDNHTVRDSYIEMTKFDFGTENISTRCSSDLNFPISAIDHSKH